MGWGISGHVQNFKLVVQAKPVVQKLYQGQKNFMLPQASFLARSFVNVSAAPGNRSPQTLKMVKIWVWGNSGAATMHHVSKFFSLL